MSVWQRERVLALAPDAGSVAAAQLLASACWTESGCSERCVWGLCQGSGQQPYRTAVDLGRGGALAGGDVSHPACSCTCPSRKEPCKHALALLLMWSEGKVVTGAAEPDFAATWLRSRDDRPPDTRAEQATGPDRTATAVVADPEAAARRAADRRIRVGLGLDDLERWLCDQVGGGLAGLEGAGYAQIDQVAARLVDAQAPGVAGMLRMIPAEVVRDGWPERVLHRLAGLQLLVEAHRRLDRLPPELAANVRSRIGYPVSKADVLAGAAVRDRWAALGQVDTVEYQLETRRVWLFGARSRRWAVILSFAVPGQSLDRAVLPGQQLEAELHFYPGSSLRALIGRQLGGQGPGRPDGEEMPRPEPLAALQRRYGQLLALDPWASRMPAVVAAAPVRPGESSGGWLVRDATGRCRPIVGMPLEPWPLLARSAGEPIAIFGEWEHQGFRPLSVLPDRLGNPFSTGVAA